MSACGLCGRLVSPSYTHKHHHTELEMNRRNHWAAVPDYQLLSQVRIPFGPLLRMPNGCAHRVRCASRPHAPHHACGRGQVPPHFPPSCMWQGPGPAPLSSLMHVAGARSRPHVRDSSRGTLNATPVGEIIYSVGRPSWAVVSA